jgi:hypothetical protein
MFSGHEIYRINNVAARVIVGDGDYEAYHPDCLADASIPGITDEDVTIDHPYAGGPHDGFTHWYEPCAHCGEELGDSAGVQPEDEDEDGDED